MKLRIIDINDYRLFNLILRTILIDYVNAILDIFVIPQENIGMVWNVLCHVIETATNIELFFNNEVNLI